MWVDDLHFGHNNIDTTRISIFERQQLNRVTIECGLNKFGAETELLYLHQQSLNQLLIDVFRTLMEAQALFN